MKTSATRVEKVSVLTQNVWFDSYRQAERYQVIMRILEQSDADFICLQEVIKDFSDLIFSQKWVQDKYFVS